jgi:hypothetical protein
MVHGSFDDPQTIVQTFEFPCLRSQQFHVQLTESEKVRDG